jgi:SNF2 family DNA or RNA helicase
MTQDLVPPALAEKMAKWRAEAKLWKPHHYQERALKCMLENPYFGLLLSPGMGKTSVTLADVKVLLKKRLVKRVLVSGPLRACYDTWPAEVCDWADFKDLRIALLHGGKKEQVLRQLGPEHKICLINPEGFAWLTSKVSRMKQLDADMLVIDESSLWKSASSQRFRCLRKWLPQFSRRYILTGSPRPRHYLDLWAQIFILDMGKTLGQYISHYKQRFFFPTGYMNREWELLPGADKEINKLIAPMVLRLDAKDYLTLPKEMERTHRVELPPAVRKEYDAVEENLMSTLFYAPFVNSAAARSKCAQMANGAVYLDPRPEDDRWPSKDRPVKFLHTAKVEALVDLVNELQGEPLLVGIGFKHDVTAIRKALGDVPCINGETTRAQAAEYIDKWNRGLLAVLLGHPMSMGHSLNLQKFNAQHVAFFDLPDNYDTYAQFYLRVCRQGNKALFVMKHHFVVQDTVDVAKMRNLKRKGSGQNAFLDAMKWYSEERYGK